MNVTLRFLTDELAFENDEECREFIESHGGQNITQDKGDNQYVVKVRQAASDFDNLRASMYSKVDIKGQI
jgi:nitrous oxide reductase accessory protein NosL